MPYPSSPADQRLVATASHFVPARHFSLRLKPVARVVRGAVFLMATATVLSSLPVTQVMAADAAEQVAVKKTYSIAAGPLSPALSAFAGAAGINLSSEPSLTEGLRTAGLQGSYTVQEGFARLLSGSGLAAVSRGSNVYILNRLQDNSSVNPTETTLPIVTATAALTPTTEGTGSYTTRALTIGKMEQSIRETPQSVTVITRQQMDDQNLTTVDQVLAQSTGVTASQRNFGSHTFVIRGYALTDSNYLVDGVQAVVASPTGWMPLDTAIYDRVEVLRGAGGLVVGAGDPSGAVNLVRKRPRADTHFDVSMSVGSWNNYRTELDAGGSLNEEKTVRGRVVATFQDNDYFYDVSHSRQPMIYGVIDADIGRSTKATVGVRHQQNTITGYTVFGLPRYSDGGSLGLPRSTSLAQNWGRHEVQMDEVFGEIEHRFNDSWKGKITASHSQQKMDQKIAIPRGTINRVTLAGSNYLRYYKNEATTSTGLDANVSGNFELFGATHQLMVGASAYKLKDVASTVQINGAGAVDVFNPDPASVPEILQPAWTYTQDTRREQTSAYASSRWQLAPTLHLLLGGRVTSLKDKSVAVLTGAPVSDFEQKNEFTPYAGLIYDLNNQWSVYGSYADTFQPQSAYLTAAGVPLDPAIGANYEVGVKGELYGGRLNVSAAVFQIKRTGAFVIDRNNPGVCTSSLVSSDCYLNGGKSQSKGFELEASGELAKGWQVAAGYTRATNTNDSGEPISAETPKHLLRASTNYRLPGDLADWAVGGGLSAQSSYGFRTGSAYIHESGRAVWDLNTSYRINRQWTAAVRIANLFDRTYYSMVGSADRGNYYGQPRSATLTVRGSF